MSRQGFFASIANRFRSTRPDADEDGLASSRRVRELLELKNPKQTETSPTETHPVGDLKHSQ